jgi:SAM-dependent methyltransferase
MPTVAEHYRDVLSDVYAWMYGGFEVNLERNARFFAERDVRPRGSGRAVDLGAGCGFQSIPLAQAGFRVTAIDLDSHLLEQLAARAEGLAVDTVCGDLGAFAAHVEAPLELAVCMTDTVLHLENRGAVTALFAELATALEPGGRFVLTARNFAAPLDELDRFIPVRSDENTIFTCFLEYEDETVKVHDLVYRRVDGRWQFLKSFYRKLRLAPDWLAAELERSGFAAVDVDVASGLATLVATR